MPNQRHWRVERTHGISKHGVIPPVSVPCFLEGVRVCVRTGSRTILLLPTPCADFRVPPRPPNNALRVRAVLYISS